jgi:integrase
LPARLRLLPQLEILTFEYNHRDPDVMALLTAQCDTINARGLKTRSGRTLRIHVDPAPPPTRPPTGRRTKTGDRFKPR